MGKHFAEIAFTPTVQAEQERLGSAPHYAKVIAAGRDDSLLTAVEAGFIRARDSVYMATVSETGWPYMQHRGGPPGFVQVLDAKTIGFADLTGNRQHISVGNLANNDRVSLFFMDYANRRRLKLLGHARVVRDDPALLARLTPPGAERQAESAVLIEIAGHDWNCPQHITPRFTAEEWAQMAPG
ncbi:pyridoxamine 5'-phosphate oxidase family protein [Paracraurococcus ruber]|uniref:Pyridoxamine 5-phosphate oxidase n=1 Tax=Paracraurococcus ruber TaxID=77675 RepID=A0ABS1CSY1_9PROT|nr:pyridoxamine 5'-phosphate oxidase family protein [Paracraurococcus ruber]MBK1657475.1 pyridoxamine 5-phosphate oxidase [Paracraurococcus ruber]TDG29593.1 pyridoxamine 5-phosphate oxidase [Paracraurococcus ruber]